MWYPATETVAPANEPVSLEDAKRHLRVMHDDDDDYIDALISTARDHVEKYCGAHWVEAGLVTNCDDWCDLSFLPFAPVTDVSSIAYTDADGAPAVVDAAVYEFRADARAVVLKSGQHWPIKQTGSRIALTATVGADTPPPAVKHAILLRIEDFYEHRGSEEDSKWSSFDSLLSNYRYY
ncbi:head-tail connector protein [Bosea thiooxidans]